MATPRTTVSFSDIQTEFGGTNPISLSEYRGDGTAPETGQIRASNLLQVDATETLVNEAIAARYNEAWGWMDGPTDIAFGTDYAIVVQSFFDSITIHDVSEGNTCGIIGYLFDATNLPNPSRVVVVDNSYAYITNLSTDELTVVDLSTPRLPSIITKIAAGGGDIIHSGNYLYISRTTAGGFVEVDITTRTSPVATIITDSRLPNPTGISRSGNYVFVGDATNNSVVTIDISTPGSPSIVGELIGGGTINSPTKLLVNGSYMYMGSLNNVSVFNISSPTSIVLLTDVPSLNDPFEDLVVSDANDMVIVGTDLWVLQPSGGFIERYDISSPALPVYKNALHEPLVSDGGFIEYHATTGRLYASSLDHDTVVIINIDNVTNPIRAAYIGPDFITAGFATLRDGNYLYVTNYYDGSGLYIYDASLGPDRMRLVGQYQNSLNLRGVRSISKQGNTIFCGCNFSDYIVSIDVTDPTNPIYLDRLAGDTFDILLSGNRLYASSPITDTIRVIDISDPSNMSLIFTLSMTSGDNPGFLVNDISRGWLYAIGNAIVVPIDLTDPDAPTRGTSATDAALTSSRSAVKSGNFLYINNYATNAVTKWNIATPGTVTYVTALIDATNLSGASALAVSPDENTLYVGSYLVDRFTTISVATFTVIASIQNTTLLNGPVTVIMDPTTPDRVWMQMAIVGGVAAINVQNSAAPFIEGVLHERSVDGAEGLCANGFYLYCYSDNSKSLTVFDTRGNVGVHKRGTVISPFMGGTNTAIFYYDDHIYVGGQENNNITIVNVKNPDQPYIVSQLTDSQLGGAVDIFVEDDIAYICCEISDLLVVVDVSDPSNPSIIATSAASINLRWIAKRGDYLYISGSSSDRFFVYDVSTPTSPSLIANIQDSVNMDNPYRPALQGNYAYVCGYSSGTFNVIDITVPASPSIVATVTEVVNMSQACNCVVSGARAYVASRGGDKIAIIDITNPLTPSYVSSISDTELDGVQQLVLKGNRLYAAGQFDDAIVTLN